MNRLVDAAAKIGFHGAIGLTVILAVVFVAVYGTVHQPGHSLTNDAVQALILGVGAIIGAAVFMLRGGGD